MKTALAAFTAGLLFAIGLALGGMTSPDKIVAFLDITGEWDPTLAFVMLGALATYAPLYHLITRRRAAPFLTKPLLTPRFEIPTRRDITPPLIIGAALFGAGWALSGFCPGPAIASAATLQPTVWTFLGGMIAGMLLYRAYEALQTRTRETAR